MLIDLLIFSTEQSELSHDRSLYTFYLPASTGNVIYTGKIFEFYQLGKLTYLGKFYSLFVVYWVGKIFKCQLLLIGTPHHATTCIIQQHLKSSN